MEQTFPDRPLFRGLLDEGETLVLYGPSNLGKSALTFNMAFAGASFAPDLLGTWPLARAFKTLFVQAENSGKSVQSRVRLMLESQPTWAEHVDRIAELVNPETGSPFVGKFTDGRFLALLKDVIKNMNAGLFVVDPLISYYNGNENDNAEMRHFLDRITEVCWETGAACVLVHHVGKAANAGPRGAQALFDWADNVLRIEDGGYRPKEDRHTLMPVVELTIEKSRNNKKGQKIFTRMNEHLVFTELEQAEKTCKLERLALVRDTLEKMGGFCPTQKALIDAVRAAMIDRGEKALGERALKYLVRDSIEAGLIVEEIQDGKKARGLLLGAGQ
jgi:hypothetical protein